MRSLFGETIANEEAMMDSESDVRVLIETFRSNIRQLLDGRDPLSLPKSERRATKEMAFEEAISNAPAHIQNAYRAASRVMSVRGPGAKPDNDEERIGMLIISRMGNVTQRELPTVTVASSNGNGKTVITGSASSNGDKPTKESYSAIYRAWIVDMMQDQIPSDGEFAHCAGCSRGIGPYVRRLLEKDGYRFSKVTHDRWEVIQRPAPPPPIPQESRPNLDEIVAGLTADERKALILKIIQG